MSLHKTKLFFDCVIIGFDLKNLNILVLALCSVVIEKVFLFSQLDQWVISNHMGNSKKSGVLQRMLNWTERAGNALPHPATLFALFALTALIGLSTRTFSGVGGHTSRNQRDRAPCKPLVSTWDPPDPPGNG